MKRQIITLAIAAAGLFSINSFAQTPSNNGKACCADKKECVNKKQCADPKKCADKKECKGKRPACNPFEGLNLTDAQKTRLEAIPCPRKVAQEMKQATKNENIKGDKEAAKTMRKEIRANYLRQVKEVLTADQYVTFLENFYINNPGAVKNHKNIKGYHGGKKFDKRYRPGNGVNKNGKKNKPAQENVDK